MVTAADESDEPRAADGRVPGRRGLATRQRLLDVTRQMVETSSYRDLKVVDIARSADASPATFYQYFSDVESAVLVLAAEMAETGATELHDLIASRSWDPDDVDETAATVADGFIDFWHEHASLIRVMDLAALEGDERFRDLRTWLLGGPNNALQKVVVPELEPGTCFRLGDSNFYLADPADCADADALMFVGNFDLDDGEYPGEDAIREIRSVECARVFAESGVAADPTSVSGTFPGERDWRNMGQRTVACDATPL